MTLLRDITGQTFGRFTVIEHAASKPGSPSWLCRCVCGNTRIVLGNNLRTGKHIGCGCHRSSPHKTRPPRHGMSHTPTHRSWGRMKERCYNAHHKSFPEYGGRGIRVCERWLNSFEAFLADMGERPSRRHTLDRINGNGNYEPGNCRWLLPREQVNNRRKSTILTAFRETKPITLWLEDPRCLVTARSIRKRILAGWSVEDAISKPATHNWER